MAWLILIAAGLLEVVWAIGLKYTHGFSRVVPTVVTILAMIASMGLLGLAVRSLPIGTAYAVWTGIGTVGTVIFGILVFGESASLLRLLCVSLIVIGIIGLKALTTT
jgi:quaternary ammonium compound-resistance protein SugE